MSQYHVLIPCAGAGTRMQSSAPKQYMLLNGSPILRHVIALFESLELVNRIYIVISAEDTYWSDDLLQGLHKVKVLTCGGDSRAATVLAGLQAMPSEVPNDDWVLVHDAARPGVDAHMVQRLIDAMGPADIGGLLALPLADTLKRANAIQRVEATLSRDALWQAQTPQMFKLGMLKQALAQYLHRQPTDEAQAMEWAGHAPKLVLGDLKNLKITYPQDLIAVSALMQAAINIQEAK